MAGAAAAGAAFGPWGMAAGAAVDLMGSGSGAAPAGPSQAKSDNVFDSSGWTVATAGSKASSAPAATSNPWLIGGALVAVALIALVWIKR